MYYEEIRAKTHLFSISSQFAKQDYTYKYFIEVMYPCILTLFLTAAPAVFTGSSSGFLAWGEWFGL